MYTTTNIRREDIHGPYVYSYVGKSSYTKPTGDNIATGSDLYDLDTQKVYMFDADAQTWVEQ
jgi:hypothetical protein